MNFRLAVLLVALFTALGYAAGTQSISQTLCGNVAVTSSGSAVTLPQCGHYNISFDKGVSGSSVNCNNATIGNGSVIYLAGNNLNDSLWHCTFNGSAVELGSGSSLSLLSPVKVNFSSVLGNGSRIYVDYTLRVNVFEPFGSNSIGAFGDRVAAYGYLVPLMQGKVNIRATQMQMAASNSSYILSLISNLSRRFGIRVYNETQTQIFLDRYNASYGKIIGSKSFQVTAYMITKNGTVDFNPYAMYYSFFAYDQLIMFDVNVTRNMNITPVYIAPVYPKFNFHFIPNNPSERLSIKYILAIPPQDLGWNFSTYIYRYNANQPDGGFIENPYNNSVGYKDSFIKVFQNNNASYNVSYSNGARYYTVNYTSALEPGINSSIVTEMGNSGANSSYIQDSTTPSFSFGVGYCSTIINQTSPFFMINTSGTYYASGRLRPLIGSATPLLADFPCSTGFYVKGSNMAIICRNSTINDTIFGGVINDSYNVSVSGCRFYGNGLRVSNSTDIHIYNISSDANVYNDTFGLEITNSSNVSVFDSDISQGYFHPYAEKNSSIYLAGDNFNSTNSTITGLGNMIVVPISKEDQDALLALSTIAIICAGYYLFVRIRDEDNRRRRRYRNSRRRKR